MRVIISSQFLYFFRHSPPDPSSLEAQFGLDDLVECRAAQGKTSTLLLSVVVPLTLSLNLFESNIDIELQSGNSE